MVYLVTNQKQLFESEEYKVISVEASLQLLNGCKVLQYDSESDGRDAHINKLLLIQFGSKVNNFQIVVDVTTVSILLYKEVLETKFIIGQNLKFDLQFLYNYGIVPMNVYDTMIVEQLLYLGWSNIPQKVNYMSMSLASIAERRLGIFIDKTVRGQIIWRGIDTSVILYAAKDVEHLEDIMWSQVTDCKKRQCLIGARLECDFVPVVAYLEWCGIKLDVDAWKEKMKKDYAGWMLAKDALNDFIIKDERFKDKSFTFRKKRVPFISQDFQGDLFSGFDTTPQCNVSWTSSDQVIEVAKILGFDTKVKDKNTGEEKDSVIEKHLKKQKKINDDFLRLYFGKGEEGDEDYFPGHQGMHKLVTSFGQGHLNAINPKTGRIHTQYKQLGADTGRMSSGSKQNNDDLAKFKGLPINPSSNQKKEGLGCPYPNMQQLPNDVITRSCFIAEEGNLWASCDYSAIESRLGADVYQEKAMIDEFLYGSGDMHSLVAKMVFDELKDVPVKDIKKKFPHLRNQAKPIEFSQQFGGSAFAIQNAMGCTIEKAQEFADAYAKGFKGIASFKAKGSAAVRKLGYIVLSPHTGHKTYWWDHDVWLKRQESFTQEFWEEYKLYHKGTGDATNKMVSKHFKAASKWDRKALNSVTQGLGAVILKDSQIAMFKWVVKNGYFGKVLLVNLTHDEANWEYPKELTEFPNILKTTMEKTADKYCKSLPIPAEVSVGKHWIH